MNKAVTKTSITKILLFSLCAGIVVSCSSARKAKEKEAADKERAALAAAAMATSSTGDMRSEGQAANPNDYKEQSTEDKGHEIAVPAHRKTGDVPAEKSLGWLKNGNTRFKKGNFRKDGMLSKDISRLASGQAPHAVVLSCSDSRVPPEIVFDQKLGEIFVVRAAGEALDSATIGSIEYAIEHLGSNLLVVMGHESCGAVKAAFETSEGDAGLTPDIDKLLSDIRPRIEKFKGRAPTARFASESWANVLGVAKDLLNRSKLIRSAVASGELMIKPALYHMGDGTVEWK